MPTATNARKIGKDSAIDDLPSVSSIRGADTLLRAIANGEPNGVGSVNASKQASSPRDRKNARQVSKLLKRSEEALDARRYKVAETIIDEALSLLDTPPPRLWCYRLLAASKAANYDYVVDNYKRIRAVASCEEELVLVDRAWVDCLIAAGFLHQALEEAEMLCTLNTSAATSIKSATGIIHARLGDHAKAIAIQKSILAEKPSNVMARWNLAIHQLEAGDLPAAFDNYEARWDWADFPSERRTFDIPRWKGESPEGKRVLVWREQGVGDEIRFTSILPDLIAAGARITFECSPKLLGLFRMSFPDIEVRPEQPAVKRRPEDYLGFDYQVPVGSLVRHFRPTVAQMQANCRPWLKRDGKFEGDARAAMKAAPHQPVIGLCWRSSNQNLKRSQHYLKAEYFAPLKLLGRSGFICLQYDECREEVKSMRGLGLPIFSFSDVDQMNDLVSASYLTGACDLVISASTATSELAAGLGVPTIRFGLPRSQIQLGTDTVPWHPATRCLPLDPDDPIGVAKSILFNWKEIAAWAAKSSTSGRQIDWRLSFPGAS